VTKLIRLALLVVLAVWAWRRFFARRGTEERAAVAYADGSSLVFEAGSPAFERLAATARTALGP
jgi:hypothetical protein